MRNDANRTLKPCTQPNRASTKGRGFTLLELIIVMALIGLLAGLVIPRITGNELSQLKAQVREAVAVLKHARRNAVISGKVQKVSFFSPAKPDSPASRPASPAPGQWLSQGALIVWKGEQQAEREESAYIFRFYPGGGSSGGTFILEQGRFRAAIKIHPMTGKIEVEFMEPKA